MTAPATNDRVGRAIHLLTADLQPYVAAKMEAQHGKSWPGLASRARGAAISDKLDAYGLLKTMIDNWQSVFAEQLPRAVRSHVNFALDGRNE